MDNKKLKQLLEQLAGRIKQARINLGITQIDLANNIGMSVTAIKKAEKGECKLSTFLKVVIALNLDSKIDLFVSRVLPSPVLLDKANTSQRKRASKGRVKPSEDIGW